MASSSTTSAVAEHANPIPGMGREQAESIGGWTVRHDVDESVVWISSPAAAMPEPADWQARLLGILRRVSHAAVVGAKRLSGDGRLFSMGEMVVHPMGFHHVGKGVLPHAFRFPEPVDAIAGGVMVVDASAFAAVKGSDHLAHGVLGALELCLAIRSVGHQVIAAPQATVIDETALDDARPDAGFESRWKFDWRAADLDAVGREHSGSGLMWQARFQADAMPFDKYERRPAQHWTSYRDSDPYRQRADHLAASIQKLAPAGGLIVDLGCGDGLFSHLVANGGHEVIGVDPESNAIEQARSLVAAQQYPGPMPRFEVGFGNDLDLPDSAAAVLYALDVIEHLSNPVAVLREIKRVVRSGGRALITTPAWQYGTSSDPFYHGFEYTPEALARQINAIDGLRVVDLGRIGGVYRDIVAVIERV